ncbi:hypothetical protein [Saccharopolyspora hirsuta]|uniref:hypothetical protein n=1 Tax=Saccharopolyspora hirsuta TaxID=1837 RepID=UPI0014783F39|nr:hypothetical protein [Saccharopolyspora hirsuta]
MGWNSKKQAADEYKTAQAELEKVSRRDRTETDEYLAANDRVARAAQNVPWWRR